MTLPLQGARIWVSRPQDDAVLLNTALSAAGASVISAPLIEIVPLPQALEGAHEHLNGSDWVLITSANAARCFCAAIPVSNDRRFRVAALGKATADAVCAAGWPVDLIGDGKGAVALARLLIEQQEVLGRRFFYPCSEIAADPLKTALEAAGAAHVTMHPSYRTVAPRTFDSKRIEDADLVILYSGSAAENLHGLCRDNPVLSRLPAVAIGETTARKMATFRTADCEIAADPSTEAVVAAAISLYSRKQKGNPS